jgi:hypothetical protein
MHLRNTCFLVSATFASHASASFTGFLITLQHVVASGPGTAGQQLLVYSVFARFNSPTDTLLSCSDFRAVAGIDALAGFWHKDNASGNSGVLARDFGTWNPGQTGSGTANRPYDSYLTIGGLASGSNTTQASAAWLTGGNADTRGWNRPDLPNNGSLGWFNSNPLTLQGQVGQPGNTSGSSPVPSPTTPDLRAVPFRPRRIALRSFRPPAQSLSSESADSHIFVVGDGSRESLQDMVLHHDSVTDAPRSSRNPRFSCADAEPHALFSVVRAARP